MKIESKKFSNKAITVTYDPSICTLSGTCAKELSNVFSDKIIPWVNLEQAETDQIVRQIKKCPSGALKFKLKQEVTI